VISGNAPQEGNRMPDVSPPAQGGAPQADVQAAHAARETLAVQRVIQAQENERRRVARELHDEIGQALSGLVLVLGLIQDVLPSTATQERQLLEDTMAVAGNMMSGLRRIIAGLRPAVLDDLGLVPALRQLGVDLQERTGVEVELHTDQAGPRLAPEVELTLFRVAQEALTNVGKHAHARHVRIVLQQAAAQVRLCIEDDGQGLPALVGAGQGNRALREGHQLGILGMRERVALLNGVFEAGPAVPQGTRIEVQVPLDGETAVQTGGEAEKP
jgi:signal transduction histidine kinase